MIELELKYELKNKIMLSLTWRNGLASKVDKVTGERLYNEEFKKSDYFKFLNNLMNDERLLKVLKEKDYKIRFIPHPNVLCQLKDFNKNEFIEIEEGSINYQKEFCENKVLVTDYSSVSIDFAYMKKPLIYYQFDQEEFQKHLQKGYFSYEKDGFGPVEKEEEKVVEKLIQYVLTDYKQEEKYQKRTTDFFKYHDQKNSKRIYEYLMKIE